jgi:hypothetical protein
MPITGNFSLQTVNNEFGSNSRPSPSGLSQFHQVIAKDSDNWDTYVNGILGRSDNGQLRDFTNTGQPSISDSISTSTQWNSTEEKYEGKITFGVTPNNIAQLLDVNGNTTNFTLSQLRARVFSEYYKGDNSSPFSGQTYSTTSTSTYTSVNNSAQISLGFLDSSSEYQARLKYYNRYNSNSNDYSISPVVSINVPAPPQLVTPSIQSATWDGFVSITITWIDSNSYTGMNYELRYKVDLGNEQSGITSVYNKTNWNGTGTKSATWDITEIPDFIVEVSIRAVRSPYQTSNWTPYFEASI